MSLRVNKELAQELTPVGLQEGREQRKYELARRRASQQRDALHFLFTGQSRGIPPYGKEWNREYNPWPYPEAKPDPYEYEDTGVGAIYGFDGSQRHMWQLAGWSITRRHAEQRKRRK